MSSLNEFKSYVRDGGIAKNNKFLVQLNLPEKLSIMKEIDQRKVILFCDQAALPGVSFGSAPVRSYGETREIPYEKLYEPITLSFYVDADMTVKYLFDRWIDLVQNPTSRDFNYPKIYQTELIDIFVENTEGRTIYACALHNCFPKAIAPIQLDYAGKDVMKLSVTMVYQYYKVDIFSPVKKLETSQVPIASAVIPEYDYGYQSLNVIPQTYFDEFASFQNRFEEFDFSTGGVRSLFSAENIGEFTGFGGIFS